MNRPRRLILASSLVLPAVVGLAGAQVGMLLWGSNTAWLGPFKVEMSSSFGRGETVVALPPLGRLSADTHLAPLRVTATLEDVQVPALIDRVRSGRLAQLAETIEAEALRSLRRLALKMALASVLGALALGLLAFRGRWPQVAVVVATAVAVVGASQVAAWRTYRPDEMLTPRFSGSLALAPGLIGPAETALDRLGRFQSELARIVQGTARVYGSVETSLPGQGGEVRVLHISDVHLSPIGLSFAREVARSFDVDFVLDTGDLTSFGTPAEELILGYMAGFRVPYLFVLGNHDSRVLPQAMARIPNVAVLQGRAKTVKGVTVYGLGHPVFTPDKEHALDDDEIADAARAAGLRVRADIRGMETPPAIVAVHDDRMAEAVLGLAPLVVSGHFHKPGARSMDGTLFLRIGSTGGAGANVFTQEGGIPLSAEILYFRPGNPASLVAYDVIEQLPESGSITVKRNLPPKEEPPVSPSPTSTEPLTPPAGPS